MRKQYLAIKFCLLMTLLVTGCGDQPVGARAASGASSPAVSTPLCSAQYLADYNQVEDEVGALSEKSDERDLYEASKTVTGFQSRYADVICKRQGTTIEANKKIKQWNQYITELTDRFEADLSRLSEILLEVVDAKAFNAFVDAGRSNFIQGGKGNTINTLQNADYCILRKTQMGWKSAYTEGEQIPFVQIQSNGYQASATSLDSKIRLECVHSHGKNQPWTLRDLDLVFIGVANIGFR